MQGGDDRVHVAQCRACCCWRGGNCVYVHREHDLVVVRRWVPDWMPVITAVLESLGRRLRRGACWCATGTRAARPGVGAFRLPCGAWTSDSRIYCTYSSSSSSR
ncbi:MAG: hypothetical protein ACK52I_34190 [Pseudomonadota bacterium]